MRFFRPARPAATAWNLVKTFASLVVVWTAALAVLPWALTYAGRLLGLPGLAFPGRLPVGAALLAAGSALGLWAAWAMATRGAGTPLPFDAARRLVVTGPYRGIRNPMAASAVLQAAGVALLLGSLAALTVPVGMALVWQLVLRPREEAFLRSEFGDDYETYRRAVPLWLPRLRPWPR